MMEADANTPVGAPLRDAAELAELSAHPGLCANCVHLRLMRSPRSTFVRCAMSDRDERFPRYPRLPVVACAGHEVPGGRDMGSGLVRVDAPGGAAARALHVTNGDSVIEGMRAGGIAGALLPWRDVLHDGPVPETATIEELSEVRARALAAFGWGSYPHLRRGFAARDAELRRSGAHEEVVLWFEHDLYDQLQLLQLLHWFAREGTHGARLSLVQVDRFPGVEPFHGLGQLTGEQLRSLLPVRQPVTARQLNTGAEAWADVRAPSPLGLAARTFALMPELPFLGAALRRLLEEHPARHDGLARSERQVLQAVAAGARDARAVFAHFGAVEDVPWGDSSVELRVATLLSGPVPALERTSSGQLALTLAGERVLAGGADWLQASGGIDRWVGGVHHRGREVRWRWDADRQTIVEA